MINSSSNSRPLIERYRDLVSSFETPMGQYTLRLEQERISELLREIHGTRILHISASPHYLPQEPSPFRQITHVVSCRKNDELNASRSVKAELQKLPFESEQFDVVIVQHALEFHENPQAAMKEAARVTKPCGHVLILSFNPLSLSGLVSSVWGRLRSDSLWNRRQLLGYRLRDWFALLNLQHLQTEHRCHVLPINQRGVIAFSGRLLSSLGRHNIPGSSVLITCARKDRLGMNFIGYPWQKVSLKRGLFSPSPAATKNVAPNNVLPFINKSH